MDHGLLILKRAAAPIQEPVTKFGGLPVWVGDPAWPTSASTGEQMLFIGQVVIDQPLFPVTTPRIAYLFITQYSEESAHIERWHPHSGENAVVIQELSPDRPPAIIDGPHLMESYWVDGVRRTRPLELAATLEIEPVPPELSDDDAYELRGTDYFITHGQRVGGVPDWLQSDEMPDGWRLLLQMHDFAWVEGKSLDTNWNFGTGNCYVLISPDCSEGLLLTQC